MSCSATSVPPRLTAIRTTTRRTLNGYRERCASESNLVGDVYRVNRQMSLVEIDGISNMAGGDSDEEVYEDAVDALSIPPDKTECPQLNESIDEAAKALDLFLSNHFNDAMGLMKPWAHISMYHALGKGTVLFMQAVLTLESTDIEAALEALQHAVDVCNRRRRRNAIAYVTRLLRGVDFNLYSEEEVHAELCYAECLLEMAILTFVADQSFVNFVKGGLRIRSCYQSYKECMQILETRNWENSQQKKHFESGVRMGVGAFNLMISQLPSRVLKLLEFIGFSGNRVLGIKELFEGYMLKDSLRSPLCSLILVAYHTIVTYIFGNGDGDIDTSEKILIEMLERYPRGALFLFFYGRVKQIRGKIDNAIGIYLESIAAQEEWRQFHYLCYWELLWSYSFKCDWENAAKCSDVLRRECRWSPATYTYVYASMLYMMAVDGKPELMEEITELMQKVPGLKQRMAGKSLPVEKYCVRKSAKFFTQNCKLLLPALELVYVWNSFPMIGNSPELVYGIQQLIDRTQPTDNLDVPDEEVEDVSLALLLRGICLKYSGRPLQAEDNFRRIISYEKKISDDIFLLPFASAELGYLAIEQGKLDEAREWLEIARQQYHGYPLETILHFRVHSAIRYLKGKDSSYPSTPTHSNVFPSLDSPTVTLSDSEGFPFPKNGSSDDGCLVRNGNGIAGVRL